jgi:hypothetical protein
MATGLHTLGARIGGVEVLRTGNGIRAISCSGDNSYDQPTAPRWSFMNINGDVFGHTRHLADFRT